MRSSSDLHCIPNSLLGKKTPQKFLHSCQTLSRNQWEVLQLPLFLFLQLLLNINFHVWVANTSSGRFLMVSPALIFLLIFHEEPDPIHFLLWNRHCNGKMDPICLNSKQISSLSYFTYTCTGTGIGAESQWWNRLTPIWGTMISTVSPPFEYLCCPLKSTNLIKKVNHLAIYSYLEGFPETRLHVSVTQT